ncbi:MAG: T9SS type A sorting domain-containing protein [Chloroflexia bacterium]|nr:T9SS type A sorting domain-containing protein [Chloroflexia bacterium]
MEFFAPEEGVWSKVDSFVCDTSIKAFLPVMKHISEEKYLKDGFRFRFRNLASLSSDKEPSIVINADHWHIDYVYLNKGRSESDKNPNDIAFINPMTSPLKNYEAMPWKHFKSNFSTEIGSTLKSVYQYNSTGASGRLIDTIYYVFYDNSGSEPNDTLFGGGYNMAPGQQRTFDPPFSYQFLTNSVDSASFTIKSRFVTDAEDNPVNNEILYLQKFYDYYAYDDGAAEASYGLYGDGTQNARLAYKFDCKKQDTLKAIQMYFARSLNDASQKYFYLTIWDDDNGEPGKVIYSREAVRPEYESGLNKFHDYFIDDTTLVLDGIFYVGWIQTVPKMLNIGLDLNRDRSDKIFYNLGGDWKNSKYKGALMIRPFFGKSLTLPVEPIIKKKNTNAIKVYPNPTNGNLKVDIDNVSDYEELDAYIYTLAGSLVRKFQFKNNSQIELSGLNEGTYVLRVLDRKGTFNHSQKVIKTK